MSIKSAVALVLLCAAASPVVPGAAGAGLRTYADPAGDAGAGFDITSVAVSNTRAGKISFRISLPAVAVAPPEMVVSLALNTDGRPTGSNGVDYVIVVLRGVPAIGKLSATGDPQVYAPRSLTSLFTPGLLTVSINRRDLDDVGLFQFLVASYPSLDGAEPDPANTDTAPSAALGQYLLALPTSLVVRSAALSPSRPAAGGTFSARVFVRDTTYADPGPPAEGGVVTCRFTVGGRPVSARGTLARGGRATCDGRVPADAAGQRLAGTVRYRVGGATLTRALSATVR